MGTFVREHPDTDRSKVVDEGLQLWWAERQREAMIEQYAEEDGVPADEWKHGSASGMRPQPVYSVLGEP